MWRTKIFKTKELMQAWLYKKSGKIQFEEIAVNNAYGVTWRPLRVVVRLARTKKRTSFTQMADRVVRPEK